MIVIVKEALFVLVCGNYSIAARASVDFYCVTRLYVAVTMFYSDDHRHYTEVVTYDLLL